MFRALIMSALLVVLTASGCASNDPVFWTPHVDLPEDISTAGLEAAPANIDNAIPRSQAIEIADGEYGERYEEAGTTAYLVELTIPARAEGEPRINDRPVWLIRYTGLDIPVAGPVAPEQDSAEEISVSHAYVILDARSGAWLFTKETG
jgi:hypothetical protein